MPAIRSCRWPTSSNCLPPERASKQLSLSRLLSEFATTVIVDGPGERAGATGTFVSVYFKDPDGNLVEIGNYLP
jgi:catechol 2,3-dioxygenase-like lactoylglutathione lyase family enzyme